MKTNSNPFKVGDILYISWGYSMTIVAFFKVTRTTPSKVGLVELQQTEDHTGFLSGHTTPVLNSEVKYDGSPYSVRPDALYSIRDGYYGHEARIPSHKGSHDFVSASKWDGKPVYFNHCD